MPEDEEIVITVIEPNADAAARGAEPNTRDVETDSQSKGDGVVASPNGASATTNDSERTSADSEMTVGATLRETDSISGSNVEQELSKNFVLFDQGKSSRIKRDSRNDLCRAK